MVIALFGVLYARIGREPADAIDGPGAFALIYMLPLSMLAASTFSDRLNETTRRMGRIFIRANFLVSTAGTIATIYLLFSSSGISKSIPAAFAVVATGFFSHLRFL